jgi:hypothetical protein
LTSNATVWIAVLAEDLQPTPTTGITAAGTTQGGATALTVPENYVSSVPSGAGVRIAAALMVPGIGIFVTHEDTATGNDLLIYPDTGITIQNPTVSLAVNVGIRLAAGYTQQFRVKNTTTLRTVP